MGVMLELNNDTVEVEFSGTPYTPARLTGHPDSWEPAEGGEIEIEAVEYETNGRALIEGNWVKLAKVVVDVSPLLSDAELERFQEEIAQLKTEEDY